MASLYLIRHGQASFGHDDYDKLSDLGHQQAAHLGASLAKRLSAFDAISLGSMVRHRQTAEACVRSMGLQFNADLAQVDAGWNEYDHQNILAQYDERLSTAAGTQAFVREQSNPAAAFEAAFNNAVAKWIEAGEHVEAAAGYSESWPAYRGRVHSALESVIERNKSAKHIAVFTSGGPISLLSQALLGVPEHKLMHLNWTLVNAGITKIVATASRTFVATLNDHGHFEGAHKHLISYK